MADLTGQRLGQYQLLKRISRGATSSVYKAYQEKLDRFVAIKVLSPHFIDEEGFLERFLQEARAVAQLDHPNILPVYDFDQAGDLVYIVMKYVTTGTLKDLLGRPMDVRVAMEIVTQVGLALGYAHRQGVVHRDVKPSNILIADANWALLTDFGLAKIRALDRQLTRSGMGLGTPDYMSPEQAQGTSVDGRADLYSLGVTLYEMLTGQVPFDGDTGMAVVVKHITEPVRPPSVLRPELPPAVEEVVLKSLEKDPDRRYPTAETMIAALARAVGPGSQSASSARQTSSIFASSHRLAALRSTGRAQFKRVWAGLRSAWTRLSRSTHAIWIRLSESVRGSRARLAPLAAAIQAGFKSARRSVQTRWHRRPRFNRSQRRTIALLAGAVGLIVIALLILPSALVALPPAASTPTQRVVAVAQPTLPLANALEPTSTPAPGPAATPLESTLLPAPAGMVVVPAGSFKMGGVSGKFTADETPPHVVSLNAFYIDAVEVTNAQFARFATASGYQTDAEKSGDATTWRTFNTSDRQRFPVTYVTWNDASRYCAWAGKRLPTEAEWEKAARGTGPRIYPWGDSFDANLANTAELGAGQPVAVAPHPGRSPYGTYDMVGNVWEWVQDWYGGGYYADSPTSNPAGPATGLQKVIRGGSFKTTSDRATTSARGKASVDGRSDDIGFRCAESAP